MSPVPSRLDVSIDGRTVTLSGDLDSHTAPLLDEALTDIGAGADVTIEMADVGFVDSSGLRVVIEAHRRHQEASSRLVLRAPSAAVARVVEITGLTSHLNIDG